MTALPSVYFVHKDMIHLGLRGFEAGGAFIAMLTATAATGISAGDYALIVGYTGWVISMVLMGLLFFRKVPSVFPTKLSLLTVDAILAFLLIVAGIALAADKNLKALCSSGLWNLCPSYRASIAFLFITGILHLVSLALTHLDYISPKVPLELSQNEAFETIEPMTPRGEYPGEYVPPENHSTHV
ncbi:hypothetical protein THRCLA_02039 [Thraustotheca clavata]|uniref:MARVEL domain-containing protein n=1 Tax=Thraustotheca clavata TaxID=74557 RepID=A0A1W0A6D8_9STRA|nr:hypothetical protein THRCLA_02039 [Thraustotheca clavata]